VVSLSVSNCGSTKSQSQSVKIKTNSTELPDSSHRKSKSKSKTMEKKGQENRCESVCCLKKFSTLAQTAEIGAW